MKTAKTLTKALMFIMVASVYAETATEEEAAQIEANLNAPVNCQTAQGDIRILKSEKTHTGEQIAKGVASILPIGLVINTVQGDENESMKVATGHYNKLLDDKIAKIKKECDV